MIGWNVVGRPIINDVLLSNVVPSISQAAIRFVPRIRVEVVDLVIDPRRYGVVEGLVVDVVLVISTRVQTAGRIPMVLVLALIYTDHRRVIWLTCPLLGLSNRILCVYIYKYKYILFFLLTVKKIGYLIHVRPFSGTATAGGQSERATDPRIIRRHALT